MKDFFKYTLGKVWTIVFAAAVALLVAVTIVSSVVLPGLMDTFFGGERSEKIGTGEPPQYFSADDGIVDKATAQENGNKVNEAICEEGTILLKNDGALPIKTSNEKKVKVSVYGKNSVNLAYGSSGSVGGNIKNPKTIFDSLDSANFEVNPTLKNFYEDTAASGSVRPSAPGMDAGAIPQGFATGETPVEKYPGSVLSSLEKYSELALVVITRTSGENSDLPTTMKNTTGAMSETDHYLELDKNEQEMLRLACEKSDKVVLIVNSGTPMELGFLDDVEDGDDTKIIYDFASKVNGALQIGLPGQTGIMALGRILNGEVVPSGRTVDTYARDFMKMPSVENFSVKGSVGTDSYIVGSEKQNQWFIDYEEGIYVGYRYYETRGTDEDWYKKNVVYPFGYGLSYTSFDWEILSDSSLRNVSVAKDGKYEIKVKVTNTGAYAGKEVVEFYGHAPYTAGGIEKAEVVLVGFKKTSLIAPGESEIVTFSFDPYTLASYDDGCKKTQNGGYVLEFGNYSLYIAKNAHDRELFVPFKVSSDIIYDKDSVTGESVCNRFTDIDDQLGSLLSRSNWDNTMPKMRTEQEKTVDSAFIASLSDKSSGNPLTAESPEVKTAFTERAPAKVKNREGLQLYELHDVDAKDKKWNELLMRITANSCLDLISNCAFKSPSIDYIGKPETIDTDGPAGFTKFMGSKDVVSETVVYACEPVIAATWNVDLANKMGRAVGNEGLIGHQAKGLPYSGWYAPGVNIHRTPFGGRNPEYYSEDGFLNGKIASAVVSGAKGKGVYAFVKHFAVNDQETHRGGVCTWLSEQALREIYLKPFEMTVKEGGTLAIMSSFNRIGKIWAGGDYRLMTEVLRKEWGFDGMVICDFASNQPHMNFKQMVYAGGDAWLDTIMPSTSWFDKNNALDVYVVQGAAKHVLYTVVNSNAMNGIGEGVIYKTSMAYWRIALIIIDILVPVSLLGWGVAIFFSIRRKEQQKNSINVG